MKELPTMEWMLERIDVRGEDECWPWKLSKDKHGYGIAGFSGGTRIASRLMYQIVNGVIEDRKVLVLHSCDNPPCCNPAHLFTGSQANNMKDASVKGRTAKIAIEDVPEIKYLLAMGLGAEGIAEMYGVHPSTVGRIRGGQSHQSVPWPCGYTPR